jgi:uncharacterized protein with HEPN domain
MRQIETLTGGRRASLEASAMVQDAVLRNLQILAESAGRISPENQDLEPDVPWQQVRGFRNVLVHQYLGIDLEFVWQVVDEDLPTLRIKILRMRDHLVNKSRT